MRGLAAAFLALTLLCSVGAATLTESDPGHVFSKGNWQALSAVPGAVKSTAIAYSAEDDLILLYGGRHPNLIFFNELWVFNPNTGEWTEKTDWNCEPCPAGRAVHSMIYDDHNNKFIIFGGYLVSGHSFETNETWTYDLSTNTWEKLDFGGQEIPGPRHWGSLEYNPNDHRTYLFGGHFNKGKCGGDVMYGDLWRLDISGTDPTWTKLNPTGDPAKGKPSPRQTDLIYNTLEAKFYIIGGKSELGPTGSSCTSGNVDTRESYSNDIWSYDPNSNKWDNVQGNQSSYTHYPKDRRTDIVYDSQNNRALMFSGLIDSGSQYGKDTWIYDFDDDRWSTLQDVDMTVPPLRERLAATWDESDSVMYLYGVDDSVNMGGFWKLSFITNNISVNCFSKQPLIFGTEGDDKFSGNNVQNVMYGLLGKDEMRGGKGGDFLCGAEGDDKLFGEGGNDKIEGFEGNDELRGGPGDDRLQGGVGNDHLYGDTGKDHFECGPGTDTIHGFMASEGDTKSSNCENSVP
jgi:hypothetical protein